MKRILTPKIFNRQTLTVAKELLGKFLVRRIGRKEISGMITEVEAYIGPEDRASHAWRGYAKARHDKMMFQKPGLWFVYLTYGMHWMLNVVTERKGYPATVLIRAVDEIYPVRSPSQKNYTKEFFCIAKHSASVGQPKRTNDVSDRGRTSNGVYGPGRLTKFFRIDKELNGKPMNKNAGLWIEDRGVKIPKSLIKRGKRIGVEYAGIWKHKLWRFYAQ